MAMVRVMTRALLSLLLLGAMHALARPVVTTAAPHLAAVARTREAMLCEPGDATGHYVRIDAWGKHSLRIRVAADEAAAATEHTVQALLPLPAVAARRRRLAGGGDPCELSHGDLRAELTSTGALTFTRVSDGRVVLQEKEATRALDPTGGPVGAGTVSMSFHAPSSERVFGLGQHRTGRLDNRGQLFNFTESGVYDIHQGTDIVLPFYQSSAGYGFLWNLASFGAVDLRPNDTIIWSSSGSALVDIWVTVAPPDDAHPFHSLMQHFAHATGHPPPMPHWATGLWHSRNRYRSQAELLDAARHYRHLNITLSVIAIDFLHWQHFGDFAFDPACWPDPQAMVDELHTMGVRPMVSVWPFVQAARTSSHEFNSSAGASRNFAAMKDRGMLTRDWATGQQAPVFVSPLWEDASSPSMYVMDPFNPAARAYVFEQLQRNYMRYGINLFWLDEAEPERHQQDIGIRYLYHAGTDSEVGLAWSRAEQQMIYDGLRGAGAAADDVVMLSRSFFIGGARFGAAAWSGDVPSTFASLHEQVRAAQNAAVSGLYWWTTDIGGYSAGDAADATMRALVVRWFQFAAFLPLFRLHGDRAPEAVGVCGRTGAPDEVLQLRESLRPYVELVMAAANATGVPALRPMWLEHPQDAAVWWAERDAAVDDAEPWGGQFMLGPDYLVSPVTQYGATAWPVYLPSGHRWRSYASGEQFDGGVAVVVNVTELTAFPLFVRLRDNTLGSTADDRLRAAPPAAQAVR